MSLSEREEEYGKIRKDHLKAVEESKEKIQIAEESYGLVDRWDDEWPFFGLHTSSANWLRMTQLKASWVLCKLTIDDQYMQNRYLRKLDQELHKFQLELEADNRGITEVLETHLDSYNLNLRFWRKKINLNQSSRTNSKDNGPIVHGPQHQYS